jgi:RimJ/RimL family protein N-acetyltransferase
MSSREDLSNLSSHGPFDIVIDDASHVSTHQQIALASLFPHVTPGGFYIIEDLHWQPDAMETASVPKTRELLRHKCFESPVITELEARYLAENVRSIALFDSEDKYNVDKRDALGVLVKV